VLSEVALGFVSKSFKQTNHGRLESGCHSLQSVGRKRPKVSGLRDMNAPDFEVDREKGIGEPGQLLFNTGTLAVNPDLEDATEGVGEIQKFNEFVVYDEAQTRLRYVVHVNFE